MKCTNCHREVKDHEDGRDTTWCVAKLLGWTRINEHPIHKFLLGLPPEGERKTGIGDYTLPNYPTDDAAAFKLVDMIIEIVPVVLSFHPDYGWLVKVGCGGEVSAVHRDRRVAICQAFLEWKSLRLGEGTK